jgi:hypothetical protein
VARFSGAPDSFVLCDATCGGKARGFGGRMARQSGGQNALANRSRGFATIKILRNLLILKSIEAIIVILAKKLIDSRCDPRSGDLLCGWVISSVLNRRWFGSSRKNQID